MELCNGYKYGEGMKLRCYVG